MLGVGAGAIGAAALSFLPFPTFEQAVMLGLGGLAGGALIGMNDPLMGMAFMTGCGAVAGAQVATELASVLPVPVLAPVGPPSGVEVVSVSGLNDGAFGRTGMRGINDSVSARTNVSRSFMPRGRHVPHVHAVNAPGAIRKMFPIR